MPDLDYEEGGKTILATLKPTTLLAMFNAPQLEGVAQEVEHTIVEDHEGGGIRLSRLAPASLD